MNTFFFRNFLWRLLALGAASALCVSLSVFRVIHSARLTHAYLIWNLFLAWMPVFLALLAWKYKDSKIKRFGFSGAWLLFLPNAPYLVTDLIHLRERPPVPFWFDAVLFQSYIGVGLLLTFVSLSWMQSLVTHLYNRRISWIFILSAIGLSGFGIYLGRVQRWNSWDILINPLNLMSDIFQHLLPPRRRTAGLYSILYAGFLLISYTLFYMLTHLPFRIDSPIKDPR
jgi:uncharacterized membrane protein